MEETKVSDRDLSCISLQSEIDEAKRFEKEARDEKGVTGTNVVAGLLFWPAIIGTYSNANEAIEAAKDRQRHLMEIFREKGCGAANTGAQQPAAAPKEKSRVIICSGDQTCVVE